jgi:hypothetical protein
MSTLNFQQTDTAASFGAPQQFCSTAIAGAGGSVALQATQAGSPGSTGRTITFNISGVRRAMEWEIPNSELPAGVWKAGTWTVNVHVTAASGSGEFANLSICAISSVNGARATLASKVVNTTFAAGTYAFTATQGSDYTPQAGDKIVIVITGARISGTATVTVVSDQIINSPISATNNISGNAGIADAAVALSGAASGSTTSAGDGSYSFTGLSAGSYTITPSLTGYVFNPASQNETLSGSDITGVNFTEAHTDDTTLPFLGSVSEASGDSLGTNYVGHVRVIASPRAGLPNPYLGKLYKLTSPGPNGDPFLGEVVIVSGPPAGFTGNDTYTAHIQET